MLQSQTRRFVAMLERDQRPEDYDFIVQHLAATLDDPFEHSVVSQLVREHRNRIASYQQVVETPLQFIRDVFGDNLSNVLSYDTWAIDLVAPAMRQDVIRELLRIAPPKCDCSAVLRKHFTDAQVVELVLDTLEHCTVFHDTIGENGNITHGEDFITGFIASPAYLVQTDGDLPWEMLVDDLDTWWSLMSARQFVKAVRVCIERKPESILRQPSPGRGWSNVDGLRAFVASRQNDFDVYGGQVFIDNLVADAFGLIDNLVLASESLFFELDYDAQLQLICKHEGGTISILVQHTLERGRSCFDRHANVVLASTPAAQVAETFEAFRSMIAEDTASARFVNRRLRNWLQACGYLFVTADYDHRRGITLVRLGDGIYRPDKDSFTWDVRYDEQAVEFTFNPTDAAPDDRFQNQSERKVRMYRIR